jgi:hypothetical protein
MDYDTLKQSLQDWILSTETGFAGEIDDTIIELGENRIYRAIDLQITHEVSTETIVADTQNIALSTPATNVWALLSAHIVVAADNSIVTLEQKDYTWIREYTSDTDNRGTPKYYALVQDSSQDMQIALAPIPDTADTLTYECIVRPTKMTATTNETTWLGDNAPDVLLYACLCEAAVFMKMPKQLELFEPKFQSALQGLLMQENRRNRVDEERNGEIKVG